MARFVLISEVRPTGWVPMDRPKRWVMPRDFDGLEQRLHTTQTIEKWLRQDGNFWEMAPQLPVGNDRFWRSN